MKVWFASLAVALLAWLAPRQVDAEELMMDGMFGIGTGLEGGDTGQGLKWRRARLRVTAGADLRSDEAEAEAVGFRGVVELENRATLGGEVRYAKWMARNFGVYANVGFTLAPETLFGAGVGATAVIPFGRRVGLYFEPAFSAMPLGSDTPGDAVLVWALLSAGLRFGL